QLKEKVHGLLSDPGIADMLQDEYYTIREDRYVLPIRSGHKNHLDGIVHGWSGSGATVYIEPQPVVEANNRLLMAQADVDREIRRILTRLSKQVGERADEIRAAQDGLVALDLAWSAGILSRELDAVEPVLTDDARLELKRARHPLLLLGGVKVVPNNLTLGAPQTVLVVTGPNTGGKTVALKTAGLCTLMALAGLHIPAAEGSVVSRVPGVFTDIGDEQSLDESRSTFSGHIANIVEILDAMHRGSLVLLDEIAVGTDPIQGAALAQALGEAFADRGALLVVTTHYESLKALPFEDNRFRNGAMGFDGSSGQPTYTLTLDVPGTSSALRTARRLGLDERIVDRAVHLAGPQQGALEAVVQRLEAETAALHKARKIAEADANRLANARAAAEAHEQKLRERLREGLAKERDQALREARHLRDELRHLRRTLRDEGKRRDEAFVEHQLAKAEKVVETITEQ
ncbi:MAG: endonuclease MutS2, partial [Myxococcales bacterium]|nr:endonuclease MutS2 [Myxococcales bacterium]